MNIQTFCEMFISLISFVTKISTFFASLCQIIHLSNTVWWTHLQSCCKHSVINNPRVKTFIL